MTTIDDRAIVLDDAKANEKDPFVGDGLLQFINKRYTRSEEYRRNDETRWLRAYRNYRGLYGPDTQFTATEKSRVFLKVTKTKVLAAYGQIVDVLFANNNFPISVNPTKLPDGVEEAVHFDPKEQDTGMSEAPFGYKGDGKELAPGTTMSSVLEKLGPLTDKLKDVKNLKAGPGVTPTSVTFFPAMVAAKKMEKKIHDQLDEAGAVKQLRLTAFELALFGSGVMKGPFAKTKEYASWDDEGKYSPVMKDVPDTSHVSVWDFYPDPDARNMDESQYVLQRHKLSSTQIRALKNRPHFRKTVIDDLLTETPSYTKKYWEDTLHDYATSFGVDRYEVMEYWGNVDIDLLIDEGVDIPDELLDVGELQANVWFCGSRILRIVLNPFKPANIPYYIVPYELNPYSIFGVGVAENMDDTQTLMNGFMRMAVDNGVLSGNLVFEIDETNLVPGQDLTVYPGKVFRRQGGAPGQALFGTKFPNVSQENLMMFDKARQLSDEATGLPSFAHGQTGIAGVGRTASGISMLMNAASGNIKTVIKNVDDYLLAPLGKALFSFNMQFDFDQDIKGDLEVSARGTESLMANEVRSQRLMQFMQIVANPALMPFAKIPYIIREIAKSMDLDPDMVTNSVEEAARQAALLPAQQAAQQGVPQEGAPSVQDMTGGGGGNIGVGATALPGEAGFSGTNQPQV